MPLPLLATQIAWLAQLLSVPQSLHCRVASEHTGVAAGQSRLLQHAPSKHSPPQQTWLAAQAWVVSQATQVSLLASHTWLPALTEAVVQSPFP